MPIDEDTFAAEATDCIRGNSSDTHIEHLRHMAEIHDCKALRTDKEEQ